MVARWMGLALLAFASTPARAQDPSASDQAVQEIAAAKNAIADVVEPWLAENAPWLLTDILGTGLWRFGATLITMLLFALGGALVMQVMVVVLRRLTAGTATKIDDELIEAVNPPLFYLVFAIGVYLGMFWPNFPSTLDRFIDSAFRVATIIIVGWSLLRCTGILTRVFGRLAEHTESDLDDYLVPLVARTMRVVLIALIAIFCLQELGYNVAGLLAGLGVGGLAFALAAQDTVSNWLGALMIYTDRPFKTGDWIKTPDLEGVVEEVGLRSTKIRTFGKTVVSIPNNRIADAAIENLSRRPLRRISFELGVTYSTTPDMMRALLRRLKQILRQHEGIDQGFWLVKFNDFGASSLNIMIYCFTVTIDWNRYLSIREDLNLKFMDAMAEIGVEPAFPSHSVYMEQPDAEAIGKLTEKARAFLADSQEEADLESDAAPSDDADGGG